MSVVEINDVGSKNFERANPAGEDWPGMVAAEGWTNPWGPATMAFEQAPATTQDKWAACVRAAAKFDTRFLPFGFLITTATLKVPFSTKEDNCGILPDVNVYSFTDGSYYGTPYFSHRLGYGRLGTTEFSTTLAYADIPTSAYHNFVLNAAGRAFISKNDVTIFGLRNANYDVATELDPGNHNPVWPGAIGSGSFALLAYANHWKLSFTYRVPGDIWVEGTALWYITSAGAPVSYVGADTAVNATAGYIWVEGTCLHYVDQNGDERLKEGTKAGAIGKTTGFIWVEGDNLRYIDASGDERYIAGA